MQIKDLPEKNTSDNSDKILIQEIGGATKHITRENFLSGINSGDNQASYIQLLDSRTSGEAGGSPTRNSWAARNINTIQIDETLQVSLNTSTFTLPSGKYYLSCQANFYRSGETKLRLRNTTDNVSALLGLNNYITGDNALVTTLSGEFTIAASKDFQIQYFVPSYASTSSSGLGTPCATGENEIYLIADIWKLG
ncbi:hypothetical protein [Calothrix sp. PCC 7507]|uniref:hypothetical protein n=1 Tax=Calothrix sp. PCC 7507 TaxID=99598 RepID=UPI00029F40B9|nr:hypothetical protein [Calothrix sp. PCC 7507]AFY34876.1 hypothetical protein Cal7507_4507 [Calothrix sp. PCC 7507]